MTGDARSQNKDGHRRRRVRRRRLRRLAGPLEPIRRPVGYACYVLTLGAIPAFFVDRPLALLGVVSLYAGIWLVKGESPRELLRGAWGSSASGVDADGGDGG